MGCRSFLAQHEGAQHLKSQPYPDSSPGGNGVQLSGHADIFAQLTGRIESLCATHSFGPLERQPFCSSMREGPVSSTKLHLFGSRV